jgi:hypothetical protein
MTAQQVNYSNFFETTLDGNVGASDTSITLSLAPTSDGTSAISAPFYLVIDPDSATNKEIILVTASSGVTMSTVTRDVEGRHSPDISHSDGTTVRMAVVGEMFEDLHDQLTSGTLTLTNKTLTSPVLNTGVSGTAVLDEDTMSSDSATQLATQQSIKAYVDAQIAANAGVSLGLVLALS